MSGLIAAGPKSMDWQEIFKARAGKDAEEAGVKSAEEAHAYLVKLDAMKAPVSIPPTDYSGSDFGKAGTFNPVRTPK